LTRLALATACCVLALAAPAEAELKAIWGPATMPDGTSALPIYQDLGVEVLEEQLSWRAVAVSRPANARDPADPAYVWPAALDSAVTAATAVGIRVALMVRNTPRWAGGRKTGAHVPRRARDYADFVVAASRRYPQVRHWMIWGEPTRPGQFAPMSKNSPRGPRAYARLLDAAYGALKSESTANVVIGGMTWTLGTIPAPRFLRWMRLPDGRPPRLDWYGHNPFSVRTPDLAQKPYYPGLRDFSDLDTLVREVRRVYRKRNRRPKLWLSEFTVPSDRGSWAFSYYVSREKQAEWVSAAYRIAHRTPYIAGLGWWTLLDAPETANSLTNGLMTQLGQPKPAFEAYKRAP